MKKKVIKKKTTKKVSVLKKKTQKTKKVKAVTYKKRVKNLPEKLINNFLERLAAI